MAGLPAAAFPARLLASRGNQFGYLTSPVKRHEGTINWPISWQQEHAVCGVRVADIDFVVRRINSPARPHPCRILGHEQNHG